MKKIAIIICLIGGVSLASAKETIYVKYEPTSCIQQYHYKSTTNNGVGIVTEYFDFHVNITDKERSVVRTKKVGTYKKSNYSIAKKLVDCDNKKAHTFQSLTGKVANGEKEILFIEEEGSNYNVYKGISASYEIYNSKYFYSHSPEYSFKYIYNKDYVPSEKLKKDSGSGVTTLFAGTGTKDCNRQFGIVQMPEHACSSQVSKEFLKDVGLYIENNGDGLFILNTIDYMSLNDYLKWRCSGFRTDLDPNNRPSEYDKLADNNTAKGGTQLISSMIDTVSVLRDNTTKGGAQTYSQQTTTVNNNNSEIVATYSKNRNTAKGGTSTPTQYSETTTRNTDNFIIATYEGNVKKDVTEYKYKNDKIVPTGYDVIATKGGPTVKSLKGRHFVTKGDTLYSLSKKYGTSIDELISWNSLSDNTIAIGDTIVVNKSAFVF